MVSQVYLNDTFKGFDILLLFSGTHPDSEIPAGLYPMAVTQSSGRIVYVVQGFAYTKYVGNMSLTFDSEGELIHIEGNPILLDSSIEQV